MGFNFSRIKKIIIRITPEKIKRIYQEPLIREWKKSNFYGTLSYAQEGEDLILRRIFDGKKNGVYIDVGAHHPKRFSNTYLFYKIGWRGINIDAMPGCMEKFEELRPDDVNLEFAISNKQEKLKYYCFNEPALNTFSKEEAYKKNGLRNYKIIKEIELPTFTLSKVLDQYLEPKGKIDILNIDVEGYDFKVLCSLDWAKHRPTVILIESLNSNLDQIEGNEIYQFLKFKSYYLIAKTFNTLIFKKQ